MFERGELDWVGSPLSFIPSDAVTTLRAQKRLTITPADGTHFFRVNTAGSPLGNKNIRKALAYAIDRKSIVTHITQAAQPVATGLVPLHSGIQERPHFEDNDIPTAWTHFQEGLKELEISKDDLPKITLCYAPQERSHKIAQAVQQQWKSALGIEVALQTCERSVLIDKLNQQDYSMMMGSWFGDISDPINFLEVFKYRETSTNHTSWENKEYITLLDRSSVENDPIVRRELLARAEQILVEEMPIIPLYHATFNHLSRDIVGVYFSPLGYLDFAYAFKGALED
jgi:oligopeptide transport system substrate-binding protein